MPAKKSNKQRKWGRHSRKPGGGVNQAKRTYLNKLRRINYQRELAGHPLLGSLPLTSTAFIKAHPSKSVSIVKDRP